MKKLLVFSVTMSLFISMNAQNANRQIESVPVPVQNQQTEMNFLLAPVKDASILNNYEMYRPTHKATVYTPLDDAVNNGDFATVGLGSPPALQGVTYLFPDSLAFIYQYDVAGTYDFKAPATYASTGFVFDPYSRSFDMFGDNGLKASDSKYFYEGANRKYYGYRLDEFMVLMNYRLPNGYNPAVRDTLRFYISYLDVYTNRNSSNFMPLIFTSLNRYALSPRFNYTSVLPSKGAGGLTLRAPAIMEQYILSPDDTVYTRDGGSYLKDLTITIPNGFEIPPGACLSIMVEYIPGFNDYGVEANISPERTYTFQADTFFTGGSKFAVGNAENDTIKFDDDMLIVIADTNIDHTTDTFRFGAEVISFENDTLILKNNVFVLKAAETTYIYNDTLYARHFNTGAPAGSQFLGDRLKKNLFGLRAFDLSSAEYSDEDAAQLYDAHGYNTFYALTQAIRHKKPMARGNDTFCINNNIYDPSQSKTAFFLGLSIGDDYIVSVNDYNNNLVNSIYPNPATTQLIVELKEAGEATVVVYNLLGQAVLQESLSDMSNKVNIATLSPGMYLVKVNQNGQSHTVKIAKK